MMDLELLKEEMLRRFSERVVARQFMAVKSIDLSPRLEGEKTK